MSNRRQIGERMVTVVTRQRALDVDGSSEEVDDPAKEQVFYRENLW